MTDPQTTTPLSPVAQAVQFAAFRIYDEEENLYVVSEEQHAGMIAAAALRAAVAQVVPESGKFLSPGTAAQIRAGFLAIAAELDPTTGTSGGD